MKTKFMTVAAIAMVLSLSSCKETTVETTEETIEESAMNTTEEVTPVEVMEMETVKDSTMQIEKIEEAAIENSGLEEE